MLSTILLGITLIAFAFYIYKFPPKSIPLSRNSICMDYSDENMNQLEIDLVRNVVSGYQNNQLRHINAATNIGGTNTNKGDAHSIWFKLETLKKFIYHIEHNTSKNDPSKRSDDLGLRFYYSRYPEPEAWGKYKDLQDVSQDYGERHTLFAIPTILNHNGINIDFNPLDINTFGEGITNSYTGTPSTNLFPTLPLAKAGSNTNNSGQNHGSLIPPVDGSGEGF